MILKYRQYYTLGSTRILLKWRGCFFVKGEKVYTYNSVKAYSYGVILQLKSYKAKAISMMWYHVVLFRSFSEIRLRNRLCDETLDEAMRVSIEGLMDGDLDTISY